MCGFAGFVDHRGIDEQYGSQIGRAMANEIIHRGPDSEGVWVEPKNGVVFAHRRLAILDLSYEGHQPMTSSNGRYVIIYNGEIYNHLELRKQMQDEFSPLNWRGSSDTETLLELIQHYGLLETLKKINGMFAFAIWDKETKSLSLARDRMGEKPIYYGYFNDIVFFGSQPKSFRAHPKFNPEINIDALNSYLKFNYIPAPQSIYKNIEKLEPGHFVVLSKNQQKIRYWSLDGNPVNYRQNELKDEKKCLNDLEEKLLKAVSSQMIADVPVGAFLSGGIDSTLITSLMCDVSDEAVQTFTIGFDDKDFNEAQHAKEISKFLGTKHEEVYVTSKEALNVIPELPKIYDEPFADSSQIPTLLVASVAKKHVTVCLSGDGGDELFGGYNRYKAGIKLWRILSVSPLSIRVKIQKLMCKIPPMYLDSFLPWIIGLFESTKPITGITDKFLKISHLLDAHSEEDLYRRFVTNPYRSTLISSIHSQEITGTYNCFEASSNESFLRKMMSNDCLSYLPDDILTKVDRASMSVSLETRAPFLDKDVVEFSTALPQNFLIRQNVGKYCLLQLLKKRVPLELIDRPKMGFGVPLASWLRGPLKSWASELLEPGRLERSGFLNSKEVNKMWSEHLSGKRNWQYNIWNILMFEAWRDEMGF